VDGRSSLVLFPETGHDGERIDQLADFVKHRFVPPEGKYRGSEGLIYTISLPADHIRQPDSWVDGVVHQHVPVVLAITARACPRLDPDLLPSSSGSQRAIAHVLRLLEVSEKQQQHIATSVLLLERLAVLPPLCVEEKRGEEERWFKYTCPHEQQHHCIKVQLLD
jgi:hypothetical protein